MSQWHHSCQYTWTVIMMSSLTKGLYVDCGDDIENKDGVAGDGLGCKERL